MKFSMIDNVTGRMLSANKAQRDFLLKTGRARLVDEASRERTAESTAEGEKPAKAKAVRAAKAPNARKGYNRRDMAAKTKEK